MIYERIPIQTKHHLVYRSHFGYDFVFSVLQKSTTVAILSTCRLINEEASISIDRTMRSLLTTPPRVLIHPKFLTLFYCDLWGTFEAEDRRELRHFNDMQIAIMSAKDRLDYMDKIGAVFEPDMKESDESWARWVMAARMRFDSESTNETTPRFEIGLIGTTPLPTEESSDAIKYLGNQAWNTDAKFLCDVRYCPNDEGVSLQGEIDSALRSGFEHEVRWFLSQPKSRIHFGEDISAEEFQVSWSPGNIHML